MLSDARLHPPGTGERNPRTLELELFLDSSVLVPVFPAEHPHHAPRLRLYTQCDPGIGCCASHSLAEVYSTLNAAPAATSGDTGPGYRVSGSIHSRFRLVSLDGDDYLASMREAAANRISGGAIYDALIARCAVQAGADQIFTWNSRHYQLPGAEVSRRIKSPDLD